MTKKVQKTTLYRIFFEICSVTHFSKIAVCNPRVRAMPGASMLSELWQYIRSIQLSELWQCFEIILHSVLTFWSKSAARARETCTSQSIFGAKKYFEFSQHSQLCKSLGAIEHSELGQILYNSYRFGLGEVLLSQSA